MNRHTMLLLLLTVVATCSGGAEPVDPAGELNGIVEAFWDEWLELHPRLATHVGEHRFDDRFGDGLSDAYRTSVRALCERGLARVEAIETGALEIGDRLTHELFVRWMRLELEALEYPEHLLPVSHFVSSPPIAFAREGAGIDAGRFRAAADYDAFLSRMRGFAAWVDLAVLRLRQGVKRGVVQPCSIVDLTLAQLDQQVVPSPRESPFWGPVELMPASISRQERVRIEAAWEQAVGEVVVPAYRRLRDVLREEYRPACRESLSMAELPDGREWYRFRARLFTTTGLEPEEIMRLGAEESRRIIDQLESLARTAGHDDGLAGLLAELRGDRRHWLYGEKAVLRRFEGIRQTVEGNLHRLFTRVPSLPLEIRPVEPLAARFAPGAFYEPPSPDGDRPGVFRVNVRGSYPVRSMEALFLHEALPGHHLQLALAKENEGLPRFRRHGYEGAFIEGWALYAEGLGSELGLYRDDLQRTGRLLMDLGRAARLVVDVGIHWFGWSRSEAEGAIRDHLLGVNLGELDRYAAIPGQALAYKVGEMEIRRLRKSAETALGDTFDARAFHDELLAHGALPLDLLGEVVEAWVESRRPGPTQEVE